MKKYNPFLTSMLTIVTIAVSQHSFAQQAQKPETLIKWRQSTFQVLAWNSNRIKTATEGQFNKDDVIRAANIIAAIANAGFDADDVTANPDTYKKLPICCKKVEDGGGPQPKKKE